MAPQEIRRRLDGSIDIGFYRERGLAARRAAMLAFVQGLARLPMKIVAAAAERRCEHHRIGKAPRPSRLAPDPA